MAGTGYKGIISFSLGFLRKPRLKLIAAALLAETAFFAGVLLLALLLFGRILLGLWGGDTSVLAMLLLDPYIVEDMVFTLFLLSVPIAVVFASVFFSVRGAMVCSALERRGLKPGMFSPKRALDFAKLFFAGAFFSLFSLEDKKFLPLPVIAFVLACLTFVPDDMASIASGLLSVALFLACLLVVARNAVRLSMSAPLMALENRGALSALHESWRLTRGKFWALFLALALCAAVGLLLFGGCFFLLSLLLSFLLVFLVSPFSLAFQLAIALALFALFPFMLLFFSFAKAAIFTDKALFPGGQSRRANRILNSSR